MKAVCLFLCGASLVGQTSFGQDRKSVVTATETVALGSAVTYQIALARADVAVAKSLLNERLLKGEVGEAIRDQTVARYHHASGKWHDVLPRSGPQGLDHVSVQLDEQGIPRNLMVDETKYGLSQLAMTEDGRQMSSKWVARRLTGLSRAYEKIHAQMQGGARMAKVPAGFQTKTVVPVPVSESENVAFWRPKGAGPWFYDGSPELFPKAVAQLKYLSKLYQDCADGGIKFPTRVFRIKPGEGRSFEVTILDAESIAVKARIAASLDQPEWRKIIQNTLSKHIATQNPMWSEREIESKARQIMANAKSVENLLSRIPFRQFAAVESMKTGVAGVLVAVPIEIAMQLFGDTPMDWSRVAGVGGLAGGSAVVGSLAGNTTTYALMQAERGYSASAAAAKIVGLGSAGRFANVAGGAVGGGATAILFAYGGYWLGYYDLQTANRSAVASVVGVGAGTAASAATLSLVAAYGTAGTGTAIAGLSGAAQTSATLAWLGGGFGMAGGTVVMWTGAGLVVVGATAVVLYGFHLADEHQDNIRLSKTIGYLSQKETFFIPTRSMESSQR